MNTNRTKFLNTYIDSVTTEEAIQIVDAFIKEGKPRYIVTPNTDIVVKMNQDPELKTICDTADLILADGEILVKISKFLGNPIKERVCMTDFIWDLCRLSENKGYKVFLLGGKEEVRKKAKMNIMKRYPNLSIAGDYSPPIGFEENVVECKKTIQIISKSQPNILMVFLGCPKQDKFIYKYKDVLQVPVSVTMGGAVDFAAGNVRRAPKWMQRAGLEWFFRFLQEPKRLFKRYFIDDMKIFKLALEFRKRASQ